MYKELNFSGKDSCLENDASWGGSSRLFSTNCSAYSCHSEKYRAGHVDVGMWDSRGMGDSRVHSFLSSVVILGTCRSARSHHFLCVVLNESLVTRLVDVTYCFLIWRFEKKFTWFIRSLRHLLTGNSSCVN